MHSIPLALLAALGAAPPAPDVDPLPPGAGAAGQRPAALRRRPPRAVPRRQGGRVPRRRRPRLRRQVRKDLLRIPITYASEESFAAPDVLTRRGMLAAVTRHGTLRAWRTDTGKEVLAASDDSPDVGWLELDFSSDGSLLYLSGPGRGPSRWSVKTGGARPAAGRRPPAAGQPIQPRRYEGGRRRAKSLTVWDAVSGDVIAALSKDRWPESARLAFSPDGKRLAVADPMANFYAATIYDLAAGRREGRQPASGPGVTCASRPTASASPPSRRGRRGIPPSTTAPPARSWATARLEDPLAGVHSGRPGRRRAGGPPTHRRPHRRRLLPAARTPRHRHGGGRAARRRGVYRRGRRHGAAVGSVHGQGTRRPRAATWTRARPVRLARRTDRHRRGRRRARPAAQRAGREVVVRHKEKAESASPSRTTAGCSGSSPAGRRPSTSWNPGGGWPTWSRPAPGR